MGRIRTWLRRVSIPAAFIICGLACLLGALVLTKATLWFAKKNITEIVSQYGTQKPAEVVPLEGVLGFELIEQGNDALEGVEYEADLSNAMLISSDESVKMIRFNLVEEDKKKYNFFIGLDGIAGLLWYSVCLCIAAFVFYRWKIRKPYHTLNQAVGKISENNLDFQIGYEGKDEFGRLCHAFERMRQELIKSNQKMWNSMEERKRLNAAFAHDLRTPLTIMQGHTDLILGILGKDVDSDREDMDSNRENMDSNGEDMDSNGEIRNSVYEISNQIARLNAFAGTMGTLQRLEDYEPRRKRISSSALAEMVSETAQMLFPKGNVEVHSHLQEQELYLDQEALAQICENILSNAARHAREKIMLCLWQQQEYVMISVEDDGKGFTKKDLASASLAYYRGEKTEEDAVSHFGSGLYISSLLAEKLGGNVTLSNRAEGGAKVLIKIRGI